VRYSEAFATSWVDEVDWVALLGEAGKGRMRFWRWLTLDGGLGYEFVSVPCSETVRSSLCSELMDCQAKNEAKRWDVSRSEI